MKSFGIFLLLSAIVLSSQNLSSDLDKPYSPSRKEWLELTTFKTIKDLTDPWQTRVSSMILVKEKENMVIITLTEANGEDPLSSSSKSEYVTMVKNAIESLLKSFEWAKGMTVRVQFI
jgi:hypothetical protein